MITDAHWSYDTPTEPGMYFCNHGDVVVQENLVVVEPRHIDGDEKMPLVDADMFLISEYLSSSKWLKINISALNKLG